jgi:hypothetical protein
MNEEAWSMEHGAWSYGDRKTPEITISFGSNLMQPGTTQQHEQQEQ